MIDKEQSTKVNYFGEECTLKVTARLESYTSKKRHTFVSLNLPWDPEDKQIDGFTEQPPYSVKGDDKENDKLWRRYNKTEIRMQKEVIQMAAHAGMIPSELVNELKFSRKYLCSCGCSPGWVSKDYRRMNYWISISSPSKELERESIRQNAISKQEERTLASMVI
jgi:hypothetical protein